MRQPLRGVDAGFLKLCEIILSFRRAGRFLLRGKQENLLRRQVFDQLFPERRTVDGLAEIAVNPSAR